MHLLCLYSQLDVSRESVVQTLYLTENILLYIETNTEMDLTEALVVLSVLVKVQLII